MFLRFLIILFVIKCLAAKTIFDINKNKQFSFTDGGDAIESSDDGFDLTRQLTTNLTTGVLTGVVPVATVLPTLSIAVPPNQTCTCVPTGRCGTQNSTTTNDGTGLIDIRIVNGVTTTTTTTIITPAIVTPPISTCQAGLLDRCCQNGPYQCGLRYPPVTGSKTPTTGQAAYGAYPWQAVLLAPGDVYTGSGALIDNLHVLTAAHRVTEFTTGKVLKIRLGEWDASATSEPIAYQEYTAAKIFIHPAYNANNLKNDVALIRLNAPVVLGTTPTVTTACMPATTFSSARCWVSGWGKNDFSTSGQFQAIQKEVDVPMKSATECQTALQATRLGLGFVFDSSSFICAGGEAGKDACTGDGGSPLMCELGGRWFVAGLVAWGIGCATGGVPGVYVNVASYVPWIQTTVVS